jgi:predicted dehydrogenase
MTRPLRVGVIGAGWAGELHVEAFSASPDAEVVALCSRTRSVAEELAARHAVPNVVDDVTALLALDLDVVSVATPPDAHLELTLQAVAAGVHVLCDKPTALTGEDAGRMYEAAESARVCHASGFVWRYDPAILHVRSLLADGAIGRVVEVHTRCALGAPVLPMTWMYDRDAGGGSLMQHGGHVIDRLRWLLAEELVEVCGEPHHDLTEAVVGPKFHNVMQAFGWAARRARTPDAEPLPTAPVTADSGYRFSGVTTTGTRAHFWESWHDVGLEPDVIELYGTTGALRWAGAAGITLLRAGREPERIVVPGSSEAGSGDLKDLRAIGQQLWARTAQAFLDDIHGRPHEAYPTLHDGWQVQRVVDAVLRSAESRSWEKC